MSTFSSVHSKLPSPSDEKYLFLCSTILIAAAQTNEGMRQADNPYGSNQVKPGDTDRVTADRGPTRQTEVSEMGKL